MIATVLHFLHLSLKVLSWLSYMVGRDLEVEKLLSSHGNMGNEFVHSRHLPMRVQIQAQCIYKVGYCKYIIFYCQMLLWLIAHGIILLG